MPFLIICDDGDPYEAHRNVGVLPTREAAEAFIKACVAAMQGIKPLYETWSLAYAEWLNTDADGPSPALPDELLAGIARVPDTGCRDKLPRNSMLEASWYVEEVADLTGEPTLRPPQPEWFERWTAWHVQWVDGTSAQIYEVCPAPNCPGVWNWRDSDGLDNWNRLSDISLCAPIAPKGFPHFVGWHVLEIKP